MGEKKASHQTKIKAKAKAKAKAKDKAKAKAKAKVKAKAKANQETCCQDSGDLRGECPEGAGEWAPARRDGGGYLRC